MSSEYNSSLISQLYNATEPKEIERILDDIKEVGDSIFAEPLLDGYRRHINTAFAHYFISAFENIISKDIGKYLDRMFEETSASKQDLLPWVLWLMSQHKYFTEGAISLAEGFVSYFPQFKERLKFDRIDLDYILEYLDAANTTEKLRPVLRDLVFNDDLEREEKATALNHLLRSKPGEEIAFLIESYEDKIKNRDIEIILAKELVGWKNGKVPILKGLIIKKGQDRAREILQQEQRDTEAEIRTVQEKQQAVYSNAETVHQIVELRRRINSKTQAHPSFRFKLFPANELLPDQIKTATDEGSFKGTCTDLRSIVQNLDVTIESHGFGKTDVERLLPGVNEQDINKTFNQFFLYLKSKDLPVEVVLDLKRLNRVLTLVVHPEGEADLLEALGGVGVLEQYKRRDWSSVHHHLLSLYKGSLEKLDKALP